MRTFVSSNMAIETSKIETRRPIMWWASMELEDSDHPVPCTKKRIGMKIIL